VIASLAIATLLAQANPAAAEDASSAAAVIEKLNDPLPEARFQDAQGNLVSLRDLVTREKPVVLTLIYYDCPMLCSMVQKGIIKALNGTELKVGRDYYGLTVSFSPRDTPREALSRQIGYLGTLGGHSGRHVDWPFLTGSQSAIVRLADAVGFRYRWDEEAKQFEHPAVSIVITGDGRISRYLYGVDPTPQDVKLAILEAGAGKVGTALDRAVLTCFRYDPSKRKYGVYAWGVMRLGAGAAGLALFTLLGTLWWGEYKKKRSAA
jgi:protein SCO1